MADATLKLSGYLTTAAEITFPGGAAQTLASAADNEWTSLSDEIDNSTNKYAFADIDMVLGSAAFTGTDSGMEIYIVPTIDGTNYPSWSENATANAQQNDPFYAGYIPTTGTTAAQRGALLRVPLPQGKYKYGFRSRANVALAGSGNTFYWRPHGYLSDEA